MYGGRMSPGASLTIGLASEATLHGWRHPIDVASEVRSANLEFRERNENFGLYHSVHYVPSGTEASG
jgi:hypothetical protein